MVADYALRISILKITGRVPSGQLAMAVAAALLRPWHALGSASVARMLSHAFGQNPSGHEPSLLENVAPHSIESHAPASGSSRYSDWMSM